MGNKVEKSFEERLKSLKTGCIIFGVLELIALVSNIKSDSTLGIIIAVIMIGILFFMYKFTSEKKSIGPILEYIFGILMLLEGILYCITIVGIIFGVIAIVLSIGIIKEASYFKKYISDNQ